MKLSSKDISIIRFTSSTQCSILLALSVRRYANTLPKKKCDGEPNAKLFLHFIQSIISLIVQFMSFLPTVVFFFRVRVCMPFSLVESADSKCNWYWYIQEHTTIFHTHVSDDVHQRLYMVWHLNRFARGRLGEERHFFALYMFCFALYSFFLLCTQLNEVH